MFSERLENLIKAALQDGKLTEQEKASIIKRAKAEKEDIDEVMIYIDSLLQKRQMELKEKKEAEYSALEKKEKEAIGPICPKCHKPIPPLALVCECGYEFKKERHESSVKQFYNKINNIQLSDAEIDSCSVVVTEGEERRVVYDANGNVAKKVDENKIKKLKEKKVLEIISTFPVPNTKEDIVEFLALSAPNTQKKGGLLWGTRGGRLLLVSLIVIVLTLIVWISTNKEEFAIFVFFIFAFGSFFGVTGVLEIDKATLDHNVRAGVWKSKFDQVMIKARSLRGDPEFTQKLDYYDKMVNKK